MANNSSFTRVDTIQLKDLIFQKVGHQKAEEYFNMLKRFLGEKLSKADFDKSCVQTIGRENLSLHNRLIRAIVQNACRAKRPPPRAGKVNIPIVSKVSNGYQMSCLQSLYGEAFHQSPRKCRSPVFRDRKFQERRSPLGPLGKSPSIMTCATELHSLSSRLPAVEDGEEVEQLSKSPSVWSHITAPPGLSLISSRARRAPRFTESFNDTCQISGQLPDSISLMSRLQKNLSLEGLGISLDCANLLNNGLDVFLKKLIEPCIGISGSLCTDPRTLGSTYNRIMSGRFAQRQVQPMNASFLDFQFAVETNPRLLGEDWPIQLEKICNSASEK